MSHWTNLVLATAPLIALTGCLTPTAARVECGKLQHVSTDYGYANSAGFKLGLIRHFVDNEIMPHQRELAVPNAITNSLFDGQLVIDQGFTVTMSAEVPSTTQAEIKSAIASSMKLSVKGAVSRSEIPNYIDSINGDLALKASILSALEQPKTKVFLVYAVINAKETHFSLDHSVDGSASSNVLNVGEFKVSVTYKCSEKLDRSSETPTAMFFKPVWLKKGTDGKVAQDDEAAVDLSNANWKHGMESASH